MRPDQRRTCVRCSRELCVNEFRWKRKALGHRQSYCISCAAAYHRGWYAAHATQRRAQIAAYKATQRSERTAVWGEVVTAALEALTVADLVATLQTKLEPGETITIDADTVSVSSAS